MGKIGGPLDARRRTARVLGLRPASAGAHQARAQRPRGGARPACLAARLALLVVSFAPSLLAAPPDATPPAAAPSSTVPTASFPPNPPPPAPSAATAPSPAAVAPPAVAPRPSPPPPPPLPRQATRAFTPGPAAPLASTPRQELLASYTDTWVYRKNVGEAGGWLSAVTALLAVPFAAYAPGLDKKAGTTWVLGFSASSLVALGSLYATRDTRADILEAAVSFNLGVAFLGVAVADDPDPFPRLTAGGLAGAGFGETLLVGINSLARRTPTSTLRANRDRLQQGAVSAAELAEMERDFLDAGVPFGQGVLALPYGAGAVVALIPAFDAQRPSDSRTLSGVFGGLLALGALFTALPPTLVSAYRRTSTEAGLSVLPGVGSLTLRYRF